MVFDTILLGGQIQQNFEEHRFPVRQGIALLISHTNVSKFLL